MSEPYQGLLPIGAFTLEVLPEVPTLALEQEGTIRLTLAALDPENAEGDEPSTLRILRKVYDEDDDMVAYSDDEDDEDEEDDEEEDKPKKKASKKADDEELKDADEEDDDEEGEEDDDEEEDFEISRTVVCTLSPKTSYQQTIDIVINAAEDVVFEVTGSYPIHLTGNYVLHPMDEEDSDDEDDYSDEDDSEGDYDLSPDEDELDFSNRIQEIPEEDSEEEEAPKPEPKQKNKKRAVEEAPAPAETKTKKQKKAEKSEDKKVAFTKDLEQGPTGSTSSPAAKKPATKKLAGGVTIEDRKTGSGPTAQPGDKVSVRYIGKLLNGSTFDSNTKGKPFSFKLGSGEVIKGWDVGVVGMSVKGERRIVIPASSAYGKKALPGIPANSTLTFDVKLVGIK